MSFIGDLFRDRIIKPAVDKEIAALKKGGPVNGVPTREDGFFGASGGGYSNLSDPELNKRLMTEWVSWTYANITVIASRVADIQFQLFKVTGKDRLEELEVHPELELLSRVNDYQTKWDLIYIWTCHMLSQGEAAWYKVGATSELSKPTELWPLNPAYLKIIYGDLSKNELVQKYEYKLPGKPLVNFKPYEIIFFKDPHPTNHFRGYGVVQAAMKDILIDWHATDYNESFFGNFARPDGVLKTDSKLSDEVLRRTIDTWNQKYAGTKKSGKTAILEQGLEYQVVSQSAKDMDFLEQQKWIRDKIMAMFKNTKVILGITEDVNRANAEASEMVWVKHNIKPKMQRLVDQLNEYLTPLYESNIFLGFEDPLPESVELKNTEYTAANGKWLTVNEIREELGRDPVQGGDVLYTTLSNIPIDAEPRVEEDITDEDPEGKSVGVIKMELKKKTKNKKNLIRYAGEIRTVSLRSFRNKQLASAVSKAMLNKLLENKQETITGLKSDGQIDRSIQEKRHDVVVKFALVFEQHMIKIVESILAKHKERVIKNLIEKYKPKPAKIYTKSADDFLPGKDEFITLSIDALRPILNALVIEQGKDTLNFLDSPLSFDFNDAIRRSVRKFAKNASKSYVSDVTDKIRKILQEGITAGDSIDQLSRKLRASYEGFSKSQSKRLARTESIRASNFATEESFKQSKIVTGKQWFTAEDERVDDECAALDGKIIELDDNFAELDGAPVEYANVGFPPLHPNCRCTISPVILNKSLNKPVNKLNKISEKPKKKDIEAALSNKQVEELIADKIGSEIVKVRSEIKEEMDHNKTSVEAELVKEVDKIIKGIENVGTE